MLDLRWPIGLLFLILGTILGAHGLIVAPRPIAEALAGWNLNAWVGGLMWLFGAAMALAAKLSGGKAT